MRLLLLATLVMGMTAQEATKLVPGKPSIVAPTVKVEISIEDKNSILTIQVEQYKAWTQIQKLQADLKVQSDQLANLNGQIGAKMKELQTKYKCEGCSLGDDMKLERVEVAKK